MKDGSYSSGSGNGGSSSSDSGGEEDYESPMQWFYDLFFKDMGWSDEYNHEATTRRPTKAMVEALDENLRSRLKADGQSVKNLSLGSISQKRVLDILQREPAENG